MIDVQLWAVRGMMAIVLAIVLVPNLALERLVELEQKLQVRRYWGR